MFRRRAEGSASPSKRARTPCFTNPTPDAFWITRAAAGPKYKVNGFGSSLFSPRHWPTSTSLSPPPVPTFMLPAKNTSASNASVSTVVEVRKGKTSSPSSLVKPANANSPPVLVDAALRPPPFAASSPDAALLLKCEPIAPVHGFVQSFDGQSPSLAAGPQAADASAGAAPRPPAPTTDAVSTSGAPASVHHAHNAVLICCRAFPCMLLAGSSVRDLAEPEDVAVAANVTPITRPRSGSVTSSVLTVQGLKRLDEMHELGRQRYATRRLSQPTFDQHELDGCTFHPEINKKSTKLAAAYVCICLCLRPCTRRVHAAVVNMSRAVRSMTPVYQRMHLWSQSRDAKLQRHKAELAAVEQINCTFQPNVSPSVRCVCVRRGGAPQALL